MTRPTHYKGGWPDERHADYRRIECERCAAVVEVAKFSAQQTSVQWTASSERRCVARLSALVPTCLDLLASIDDAVRTGRLEVS